MADKSINVTRVELRRIECRVRRLERLLEVVRRPLKVLKAPKSWR